MDGFAATRDLVADDTHLILAGPAAARRRVCDHVLPMHHFEHEADLLARVLE